MTDLHPLLLRQLKRVGLADLAAPPTAAAFAELLQRISRTYSDADSERYTMERSQAIASREMAGLYEQLRATSESSLAEEKERLQAVMSAIGDGLVVLDAEGAARFMNPAAVALLGGNAEEFGCKALFDCLEAEGSGGEPLAAAARAGRGLRSDDKRFRRRGGGDFPASCVLAPVVSQGERRGAVLVFRDISASKAMVAELEGAKANAEAANRAKSEFLAVMSHEIRTPLNGVIGMTELLAATPLQDDQRESVDTVLRSSRALLDILNDILDFSKIEAGKLLLEELEFDPRRHAEETLELVAERAQKKGLELVLEIERDVPALLRGDPGRLRQIVLNLLANAVKFTMLGEVRLQVGCRRDAEGRARLRYAVVDSGIGIGEAAQKKLFSPFTQADSSMTRRFGGTGLGLAISRRLVEAMGGAIGFESEIGVGSTFWVELPQRGAVAAAVLPQREARVLLVARRGATRASLAEQLAVLGFPVVAVADEAAALRELRGPQRPAFALIDGTLDLPQALQSCRHLATELGDALPRLHLIVPRATPPAPALLAEARTASTLMAPVRRELLRRLGETAVLATAPAATPAVAPSTSAPQPPPAATALPAPAAPAAASAAPAPVAPTTQFPPHLRLLLVEDQPLNQLVAKKMLARLGLTPTVAGNGRLGLEAVRAQPFDLVLMDCQMPEMDGFEATRAIRELPAPAGRVPIVAMTANAMQGDRERCLAAGMDDFVTKPIDLVVLEKVLAKWLAPTLARLSAPSPT
ncbi:MAG: response regulator [Planctomycetes bacterium]|nr:response regulator [Planctomycetota bacterium]